MSKIANSPPISVGLPLFNGEDYLTQTLDCLSAQTYGDFEVIICDNASTDASLEICRAHAAGDSRIKIYSNDRNLGAPENYNRVLELSSGKYFKWAAHDDLLAPEFLSACFKALENDPTVVLAFTQTKIIDSKGEVSHKEFDPIEPFCSDPVKRYENVKSSLRECNAIFGLIKREILNRTHRIGSYPGADGNLLAELALYGRFARVDEYYFFRREHPKASSWDKSDDVQGEFWEPDVHTKGKPLNRAFRGLYADYTGVLRAPISLNAKLVCLRFLTLLALRSRHKFSAEVKTTLKYRLKPEWKTK